MVFANKFSKWIPWTVQRVNILQRKSCWQRNSLQNVLLSNHLHPILMVLAFIATICQNQIVYLFFIFEQSVLTLWFFLFKPQLTLYRIIFLQYAKTLVMTFLASLSFFVCIVMCIRVFGRFFSFSSWYLQCYSS